MSQTSQSSNNWASATNEQKRKYKAKVKEIIDAAKAAPCYFCGEDDPVVKQFHHIDPTTKKFDVGNSHQSRGIKAVREEIAKCVLVCSNCHLRIHAGVLTVEEYHGFRRNVS